MARKGYLVYLNVGLLVDQEQIQQILLESANELTRLKGHLTELQTFFHKIETSITEGGMKDVDKFLKYITRNTKTREDGKEYVRLKQTTKKVCSI